jgi:hypothetical protein
MRQNPRQWMQASDANTAKSPWLLIGAQFSGPATDGRRFDISGKAEEPWLNVVPGAQ